MRKWIFLNLAICLIVVLKSEVSIAQAAHIDSSQNNPVNALTAYFNTALGEESPLYNGPEYYFYSPVIKGNAYVFDANAFNPGSVFYDGIKYSSVPMLYDIYKDEVVVLLYNNFSKFTLVKPRVQWFNLLDHHFVNVNADTLGINSPLKSGYYDELYKGKLQVLVRREKSQQNNSNGMGILETYFSATRDIFLRKNNAYYPVGSAGTLLNILKDRKKELQQYIKTNGIKFRSDPEQAMVRIASYYDHLTN